MDIMEVPPTGLYVRGMMNSVADTITQMLTRVQIKNPDKHGIGRIKVLTNLRHEVIREAHEGAIGGHFGKSSMIRIIGKKYNMCPGIYKEVDDYQCQHCVFKDTKGRYANQASVLQAYGVKRLWELVGIDIEESNIANGSKFSWLYIICFYVCSFWPPL